MKIIDKYNNLLLYIYVLIQFIKLNLCENYQVTDIFPQYIKIENKVFKSITLITNFSFITTKERENKVLTIKNNDNENEIVKCFGANEVDQDEKNTNKIVFQLDPNLFLNKINTYGKYKLFSIYNIDENSDEKNINYEGTILIYSNYIKFKNPIHAYELTSQSNNKIKIKYKFKDEIKKEYIHKITYTDDSNKEREYFFIDYTISQNDQNFLNLVLNFKEQDSPKNYTFYIYPEYDKNADKALVPKVYLHFQDYNILTDAVYVKKNSFQSSLVFFKAQIRYPENFNNFSINDNSGSTVNCTNLTNENSYYKCNFYLGNKAQPGKLTIEYIPKNTSSVTQKRDIYLILYETSIEKCYKKNDSQDLSLTTFSISEMEYYQDLFFNDTTNGLIGNPVDSENSIIQTKYTAKSISLNSGTFYIYSLISDLTTKLDLPVYNNPIDNYSLYLTIYPGKDLKEEGNSIIYTRIDEDQIIKFNSTYAPAFDEIILKKKSNIAYQIRVSKTNGQCESIGEIFSCNLNMIYNYGKDYEGDYYVYYKSTCDTTEFFIEGKIITIKRGSHLISITPTYFFQDEVIGKEITLQYDNNMNEQKISFIYVYYSSGKEDNFAIKGIINSPKANNEYITIKITSPLDLGVYYIKTKLEDGFFIENFDISFRVIERINDFNFSHHYFVLNNNAKINRLVIKVNDNTHSFGCMIEEASEKKNLTLVDNCKTFYYDIYRTGQIFFNYYYNETKEKILIPINDNITVASTYTTFFDFASLKNCYYYKYNINMFFYNNLPKYFVFLNNSERNISLIKVGEENSIKQYSYDRTKTSFNHIINNKYYIIISEGKEDSEIYLYKSNNLIGFTNVNVPQFIIKPNLTLTFHNVSCNLNGLKIEMKKYNENSLNQISDCTHNSNSNLTTCKIQNNYFYNNYNPFQYYSYIIEKENVLDDDNKEQLTFVSNKLSDSLFKIEFNIDQPRFIKVNIININSDFFFKLLNESGYYIIKNGKNDSYKTTVYKENLNIHENTLNFEVNNDNFDLDINYLKRIKYDWENVSEHSIYHYFNNSESHIFNNTIFEVEPTVFIYHNYLSQKDSFKVNITFTNQILSLKYNSQTYKNLKDCHYLNVIKNNNTIYIYECTVETSFEKEEAKNFKIYIGNNEVNLDFIFYSLDSNSKQCKTKNDQIGDLKLFINIPNSKYKDLINLNSESYTTIKYNKSNYYLNYTLKGNEINLQNPYFRINMINNENINERFSLKDLGLNIVPVYNMRTEKNEKNIIFSPEDGQFLLLIIYTNDDIINITDILSIGVGDKEFNFTQVNYNSINVTLNLSWVKDKQQKEYPLYYKDRCGTPTYVDITISIASFTIQRNYFIINNNIDTMKAQRLYIYGPYNDYIKIFGYKDNSENGIQADYKNGIYSIEFGQSSIGEYTFKIYYNLVELTKNNIGKVYVFNELDDLFSRYNIPTCSFLDNNKQSLEDINFFITIKDPNKINDILKFKSRYITNNNKTFDFSEDFEGDTKTFNLEISNDLKAIISPDTEMLLYLTENDFIDQPLYVFKYKYTNISLNSIFSDIIYTDVRYLYFDMSCKIDGFNKFYLKNINDNKEYQIQCESNFYDEINKIFRCDLSEDNTSTNPLLENVVSNLSYGDSYLIHKFNNKEYILNKKPFYLSHEIESVDFKLKKDKQIGVNENTKVQILLQKKIFYLPNIEKVIYNDDKGINKIEENPEIIFEDNSKYLSFTIYIEHEHIYTITEICRIPCDYCYHSNCWNNNIQPENYTVFSTTKFITFEFNRKYISLNNSTDNNGNKNIELIIKIGGTDKDKLENVISYYTKDGNSPKKISLGKGTNYEIKKDSLSVGKYEFSYIAEGDEEEVIIKNKVVLVANYDYEIFDLTELKKSCFYYNDKEGEFYTSITSNSSYIFNGYVYDSDLIIIIDNVEFAYSQKVYKKNPTTKFLNRKDLNINLKEKEYNNYNLFFTTFNHKISVTSFDLNSKIPYFYKDNIVTMNQICKLDNIYIKEINSNRPFSKLNCENDNSNLKYFCEVSYSFDQMKSNTFEFFIGFPNNNDIQSIYIQLNQSKIIYNAIKNSTFSLSYIEPNITIRSSDFPLNHIKEIYIDENTPLSSDDCIENSTDIIKFNYKKTSLNKSYVTNLLRIEHLEDIEKVIKNKLVKLEISEMECDNLNVRYHEVCVTCLVFSRTELGNPNEKYYQNGKCVEKCNSTENYGISSFENYICSKCDNLTKYGENFICGCNIEGVVRSYKDGLCYLPESPEIKQLLEEKPNTQCYLEDGETNNYCTKKNNQTEKCVPSGSSGILFPYCYCKPGFTGKYCELNENAINLELKMEIIFDKGNGKIDETNPEVVSNIRGIIFFLEKDGEEYIKNITDDQINNYINESYNKLKDIVENNKTTVSQIYDVLEMALYFLKHKINHPQSIRNLQDDKGKLEYIRDHLHYANYYGNIQNTQNYNIQIDNLGIASFLTYKQFLVNSEDFKIDLSNETRYKIMEYIGLNVTNSEEYIIVTLINNTLFGETNEENDLGVKAYFSTRNASINGDLDKLNNITFYISSADINYNYQLAQYYQDRKINIYNKIDKAFVEPCYLSKFFDYDLTQKYRKNNVFQKRNYKSENCELFSFESKYNRLIFHCSKFEKTDKIEDLNYGSIYIKIYKETIDNANKVYNLPIKCTKKIDDLGHNMAFWLFLIICSLEIIYIIGINILNLGSLKGISYRKGLIHDELYYHIQKKIYEDDINSNNEKLKPKRKIVNGSRTIEYDPETHTDIGEDKFYKSFKDCFLLNFKELHPIASLCHASIISPLIIHSWFFIFNTLALFGFNAIIYYEALIEKRIYDKKRNNFDYPMRKEFHKIILSILCQVALCILIKLIMIVWLSQRNDLKNGLTKLTLQANEEINKSVIFRVDQFQNHMLPRRLLGGGIILLLVVFFFYYSVVFCGIYIKTQNNWFYSGIWSLFWNWVIFAPIYILIISFIENKKQNSYDPLVYNLKRLFCF